MERRRFGGGGGGGYGGSRGGGGRDRGFGGGRRDFGGGGDFDKPKPVKVGEEYDVEITDVGAKGDGITKVENFIIFVNGARKGEKCKIRIREVANKFALADKVGGEEASESEESTSEESGTEEASETSNEE